VIRVAAVGDVHLGTDSRGAFAAHGRMLDTHADVLLLAGDLTRRGTRDEIDVVVDELLGVEVPVVAVLGNHDYESDLADMLVARLGDGGVSVLEGSATVVLANGTSIGIAGTKGFGGGFLGACATAFGEPETKAYVRHTERLAAALHDALAALDTDVRIALLHYAPVPDTLVGERTEIYPWLGSYLLAEAVDTAGADLVVHGHAHHGSERGATPAGVAVRNVAQPVIGAPYRVFAMDATDADDATRAVSPADRAEVRTG
jgi:Icc-related predicted phosphoesterase